MIETTADARRRGLLNQDYNLNPVQKNTFASGSDETNRKDCMKLILFRIENLFNFILFFCFQLVQVVV